MTADPLVLMAEVERATARLIASASGLDDPAVAAASALPGWSRGHVLTHVSRNADGLVNLLTWARTGVVTPQYPTPTARAEEIAAGAGRGAGEQLADLQASAERFTAAAAAMSAADWLVELPLPTGPAPAARVAWRRLREVEVHHVDLAAGYAPADWPDSFAHRMLHELAAGLNGVDLSLRSDGLGHDLVLGSGGPPVVAGPTFALSAWLSGRSTGGDLTVVPAGPLPSVPDWI